MKKRVRIYKSPTGEGQFLNKTAQFLRKAQMGGTPDVEDLSYPGQGQAQQQQPDENQLASLVMQDISNSRPKEEIVVKLVNIYGKDPMEASSFVDQMYQYIEQQSAEQKDADDEEEDEEDADANLAAKVEEEAQAPAEEDFYGDDSNNDMANQVADEDDEVDDDDSDVASQVVARRGGYVMRADEGMEIQNQHPITFPGVEAYLPANMADMLSGGYDVATGQVWQKPQFEAPETADDSGMSYGHMEPGATDMAQMNDEEAGEGIAEEENTDESEFRRGGAYKKGKTAYVNSVLKLVKKQMGGDQEENNPKDIGKKSDQADPIGSNLRKGILENYIGTLKNQSQMAVAKEEAEQAYDQMMQQQMRDQMMQPVQQYPVEEEGSLDEAQFGGFFRRRRMNDEEGVNDQRGLFNRQPRQPRLPRGFNQGYPPIESMDVRRSGIFGRPKEYSVKFGPMPSVMPGYGVPGVGPGFYGYGYTGTKKTPARKIVEDQAVYVNSQANKDVAAVTPGNEATNKDVKVEEKKNETPTETTTSSTTVTQTPTETKVVETVNSSDTAKEKQADKDQEKAQKDVNTQKRAAGLYTYPGKSAVYKKEGSTWYIDPSGTGTNFQKITTNTTDRVKALEASAVAYVAPKAKAPVVVPKQVRPDLVADNTRVAPRVQPINIPKVDLTIKPQQKSTFDMNTIMAQSKDPFAFMKATQIKDPKEKAAAMQKIVYPWMREEGGIVDDPFTDEYGTLQRFVYGGDEDPSLSYIDQSDIDYSDSVDTTDPYFQRGGLIRSLVPANLGSGQYVTKYMGAHNAVGQQIPGYLGKNAQIKSIDVHKTGWLTNRPKKYSITFGQESSDPRKQNLITLNEPGKERDKGSKSSSTAPKGSQALSEKEIARGERQAGRQRPMFTGRRYEKDFEEYELTPEEQKRVDENEARYQANVAKYHKDKANAANIIDQMFNPQAQKPGMTQNQIQDFQQMITNPSGVPSYAESPQPTRSSQAVSTGSYAQSTPSAGVNRTPEQWKEDYLAGKIEQSQRSKDGITYIKSSGEPITDQDFENYKNERALEEQYGADYVPRNPNLGPASDSYESYMDFVNSGMPLEEGMTRDVMTRDEYKAAYGHYAYGGALRKFIPQALLGADTPVVYTNNPAMQGVSEVDLVSLNPGIQGLQGGLDWSSIAPQGNLDATYKGPQQEEIKVGPGAHQIAQTYEPEGDVTYDFKTKRQMSNAAVQGSLLTGNALAKGTLGFIDRMQNKKKEKEMYKNLTADNLYATDPSRDRGDYDTNTGLYRPNDMGQTWNSRSKQMGGQNDYLNEDPDYVDGDEVYMTDEQIQDYLARGGQIEYL